MLKAVSLVMDVLCGVIFRRISCFGGKSSRVNHQSATACQKLRVRVSAVSCFYDATHPFAELSHRRREEKSTALFANVRVTHLVDVVRFSRLGPMCILFFATFGAFSCVRCSVRYGQLAILRGVVFVGNSRQNYCVANDLPGVIYPHALWLLL